MFPARRNETMRTVVVIACFALLVSGEADCATRPAQAKCCPMVFSEHDPNCFIDGIFGSSLRKSCGAACEMKFKQLKESCKCDEIYSSHFRWQMMKEMCDPKGIYSCIPPTVLNEGAQAIVDAENGVLEKQQVLDNRQKEFDSLPEDASDEEMAEFQAALTLAKEELAAARDKVASLRGDREKGTSEGALEVPADEGVDTTIPLVAGGSVVLVAGLYYFYVRRRRKMRNRLLSPEESYRKRSSAEMRTNIANQVPPMGKIPSANGYVGVPHQGAPPSMPMPMPPRPPPMPAAGFMGMPMPPRAPQPPDASMPRIRTPTRSPRMDARSPRMDSRSPRRDSFSAAATAAAATGMMGPPPVLGRSPRRDQSRSPRDAPPPMMPGQARGHSRSPRLDHSYGSYGAQMPHMPPPIVTNGGSRGRSPSPRTPLGRGPSPRTPLGMHGR